jgi:GGDEF domain-containing protein
VPAWRTPRNGFRRAFGRDEFAILVTAEASLAEAPAVAEKLEMQLSVRSISVAFRKIVPSIGIALFPDHGRDATALHHGTLP